MKRTLLLLVSLVSSLCFHTCVTAKDYNVVIVETSSIPIVTNVTKVFQRELTLLLPNDNVSIVVHNAGGNEERAREIIDVIAKENKPDLLVSVATLATRASFLSQQVQNTPKLFMVVADPISEGIVAHFGEQSLANITGESHVLGAKVKLDMLEGILKASAITEPLTIGMVHTDYPSSSNSVERLLALENEYTHIKFEAVKTAYVEGPEGLNLMREGIVSALKERVPTIDGYWLSTGPLLQADELIKTIYENTGLLPLFAESVGSVQDGALLGVVSDDLSVGRSAATRAKRILEGEPANSIPVTQMEKYTIAVNVSTAIKMQLPIPSSYLKLAKENVFR